jgi:hypothetical protein
MQFQLKDIMQDWLLGQSVDYDEEDIVNAFNDVERIMGSGWLESVFHQTRGPMISIPIIELGRALKEIEGIPDASKLISKIKTYYPCTRSPGKIQIQRAKLGSSTFRLSDELNELAHALTVAKFIAHFRRHSIEVELEPELSTGTAMKHPDFRIRCGGVWVYVEVVCPDLSKEARSIYKKLALIANLNKRIRMGLVVEVYLFKDPNSTEIEEIIDKCISMAESNLQPQEFAFGSIAQIFTNPWNQERLPTFAPAIEEKRPILVYLEAQIGGVVPSKRCIVKMPFIDERAQRILGRESRQLSKDHPGLIIANVSKAAGGLKGWPELIRRRLQPNLNRRISAVLITESSILGRSMKTTNRLIEHPDPFHQLPRELTTVAVLES